MLRIGVIGVGFMGMTHIEGATRFREDAESGRRVIDGSKLAGGVITAIATRNEAKRTGDWTSIQGNFGPRGGLNDLSSIKAYADYHDLLADPDIDLVDICLPTDQHEKVALESIAAGKNTLVEKPIAVSLEAADRMVAAAEEARVHLMVAHVLPFFPEFAYVANAVRTEQFGRLRAAHFRRVICEPDWSSDMANFRNLGGWGIDLHIHDNHFISALCGVPKAVFSQGTLVEGFVNHVHSNYVYGDGDLAVSCVSGGIAAGGLDFAHGFELYLDDATIVYNAGTYDKEWIADRSLTLIRSDGEKVTNPELPGGDEWCSAFTAELQAAVDGLNSGEINPMLSGTLARDALKLCYAEAKSISTGQIVEV
ncbi:MAG: Gfo/Idh/MocA family oxidoreductase [Planctomycetota bacterium]|nr:Gfo/Idh/MocA family oxidoreductase [Planctomycetota bacterium]MDA1247721.1 Gfo/Idh/MocA family oxidoreductase [Planctomycetota bacterium]